jgi:hypothetical protein
MQHTWERPVKCIQSFDKKKAEGRKPVGRLRGKWEDNIEMDLQERGLEGVDLIHLVQDRNQ